MSSPSRRPGTPRPGAGRLDVLASEWLKLRSVRSSVITLVLSLLAIVGLGAAICAIYRYQFDRDRLSLSQLATFDSAFTAVSGVELSQFALAVLGALLVTSEFATGTIRTSLAAVPRRGRLLAAKVTVFGAVCLAGGFAASFAAFFLGEAILGVPAMRTTLAAPGVAWAVVGAGLYLVLIALLGLGLGTLLRRTAGAVAAVFALLLVLPILVSLLPSPWNSDLNEYLPAGAGSAMLHVSVRTGLLSPWAGLGLLCGYTALALGTGALALLRRDA